MTQKHKEEAPEEGVAILEESKIKVQEPRSFAVLLHNDDYTSMDFVVEVLKRFFRKNPPEAVQIMLQIHHEGKGVAGIFHLQIAETKVVQVHGYARAQGFPLRCTLEPLEVES
ncbi:ATP-dependent Clp protease adapter ClpS [bacterium]|nr:ATP-dependent Clp protease adapter ClpS [bacterium]